MLEADSNKKRFAVMRNALVVVFTGEVTMNSRIIVMFGLLTLAACGRAEMHVPPVNREASTAAEEASVVAKMTSRPENPLSGDVAMKKACAGSEMHLVFDALAQGAGTDVQRTTSLTLLDGDGQQVTIAKPAEMNGYTVVGLGCAVAETDGKPYFVAQYGEFPAGCSFCEWYYLYDANGKQLTHSDPPIVEDKSMPEAQQKSPNNAEYEALTTKLGIKHPEVDYME
jgi:hypothetical protein